MQKQISTPVAILIGSLIISLSIIVGLYKFGQTSQDSNPGLTNPDAIYSGRELKDEDFLYGDTSNDIILVEYSDLECPFCKKLHLETMPKVIEKYGDKVGIVYKHFPLDFHPKAIDEAVAALCVKEISGNAKYYEYMHKIYETTPANNGLDLSLLPSLAKDLGVDTDKFQTCISDEASKAAKLDTINTDKNEGVENGVQGTPNILVLKKDGDRYIKLITIDGARDIKYVSAILDQLVK